MLDGLGAIPKPQFAVADNLAPQDGLHSVTEYCPWCPHRRLHLERQPPAIEQGEEPAVAREVLEGHSIAS